MQKEEQWQLRFAVVLSGQIEPIVDCRFTASVIFSGEFLCHLFAGLWFFCDCRRNK
jgi:hypothetical protein